MAINRTQNIGARFLSQVPALRKGINFMAKGMAKAAYGTKAWPVYEFAANSIGFAGKHAFGKNYRAGMIREEIRGRSSLMPVIEIPTFDERTRSIIDRFGSEKGLHITGLINFGTMEMYLKEMCAHEDLAQEKQLQINKDHLKDGWYGFDLIYDASLLKLSPMSGQFGRIPIEHSFIFENYVARLYHGKAKEILIYQFNYERNIPIEELRNLYNYKNNLVPKSMSNEELRKERI